MNERELLALISDSWPALTTDLRINNCILCVRTAIEVAQYFGFVWTPLAVDIGVFNELGWESYLSGRPVNEWDPMAWSMGTRCSNEITAGANGWDGHLLIQSDGWLADLSTAQFDRPAKNIHLDPWSLDTTDCDGPWGFVQNGIHVAVFPRPDIYIYRNAPDWTTNYQDLAAVLIKEAKGVRDSD